MKRGVLLILVILLSFGVVAQANVDKIIEDYVKDFIKESGIEDEEIESVIEVDKNELPEDVKIKKIEDSNIGIYEVNYTENNESKKIFVVTYSTQEFEKTTEAIITKNIQYLNFGLPGTSSSSGYLNTATGVALNSDKGYVMLRAGSITGISSTLDLLGNGDVIIKVFKNGEDTGFGNKIFPSDFKKIDYDLQSEGIVTYKPGDIIAVYVEKSGDINYGEVVTLVETTS